jgi:hypothetical protein
VKTRKAALLILSVLALSSFAKAGNNKTLGLRTEVTLNGGTLTAGFYEIAWVSHSPEATVTFTRAGHVMVTAMGKWVDRGTASKTDAFIYTNNSDGSHTLLEIRFAGQKQALVFAGAS